MTWTITLPHAKIPDGLSANWRGHWAVRNTAVQALRNRVVWKVRQQNIPTMQRVQIELVWVVKDRRKRDVDNALFMYKTIADAIASDRGTSAHLVADDSPEYTTKLMPRIEHRPGSVPHFEVILTDISHRPDAVDQLTKEYEL